MNNMAKIFKGFKQVSSVDFEKAKNADDLAGYMWFVRTEVADADGNDVANDIYDIYFGSRQYGHFRAGELEAIKSAITALEGNVEAILATLETLTGVVEAQAESIAKLEAADETIRGEFADADEALEGRVNAELVKKADKTDVQAVADRVTVNEGVIADLVDADTVLAAEIATKVSQEAYDKKVADIEKAIELLPTLDLKVVEALPTEEEGINSRTLYLVKDKEDEGNLYTEYLYVDGKWENLGKQTIDLTDYYTKGQVDDFLAGKVDVVVGSRLMTDAEGQKLAKIEEGAQVNVVDAVKVNGVEAVVENGVADVNVDATNIELGVELTAGDQKKYEATDKLSTVLQGIQNSITQAAGGAYLGVTAGDGVAVSDIVGNQQTVSVKLSTDSGNLLSFSEDKGLFAAMYYDGDDAE
jgi:hypothetical protein